MIYFQINLVLYFLIKIVILANLSYDSWNNGYLIGFTIVLILLILLVLIIIRLKIINVILQYKLSVGYFL